MKKAVINLAIVSCFALGSALAHAKPGHDGDNPSEASTPSDHGASHAAPANYFGKATVGGQTQNVQVDANGRRIPYNMAQDLPSVGAAEQGSPKAKGVASPYYVGQNTPNKKVESNNTWMGIGTNSPSGTTYNRYKAGVGQGYIAR